MSYTTYKIIDKPKKLSKGKRTVSKLPMPSGRDTCNAKLQSRDGYCQQKGVAQFHKCNLHGGNKELSAIDIFSKSMNLEDAAKMQTFITDTLNMNGELASAKVLLTKCLDELLRAKHTRDEYLNNVPVPPMKEDESEDDYEAAVENYKEALSLHKLILKTAIDMEDSAYNRAERLVKVITEGVFKNKRMEEGSKFTMDVRQIRDIIKAQLEVMANNCAGCPKLRSVISGMREKMKDIYIDPKISKANREAVGAQKYKEALDKVQEVGDALSGNDEEILDD